MKKVLITGIGMSTIPYNRVGKVSAFMRVMSRLINETLKGAVTVDSYYFRLDNIDRIADTYDLIIVELDSPWVTRSRALYTSLAWAAKMRNDPDLVKRTVFVMNTPEPLMLCHAYGEASQNFDQLFDEAFLGKLDAFLAIADPEPFMEGAAYLSGTDGAWPRVISPVHCWHDPLPLATTLLPAQVQARMIPMNLDHDIIRRIWLSGDMKEAPGVVEPLWYTEHGAKVFPRKHVKTAVFPSAGVRSTDATVVNSLSKAYGWVPKPGNYSGYTPWSRLTTLAVASHSPVFADIAETSVLGESWAVTYRNAELMFRTEQYVLSQMQTEAFLAKTPQTEVARDTMLSIIAGVTPKVVKDMAIRPTIKESPDAAV